MSFVSPTYLWALLGLLVPLVIHLWSKKEGKTVKVGSIQLLNESDSKQTRSIQLNEFLLLLVRMLLIALLVILLAKPRIERKVQTIPVTYIIESSLLDDERILGVLDTIDSKISLRILEAGFPILDKDALETKNLEQPNYWQLLKEMETLPTDSIVVFTKVFSRGLRGMRPDAHKNIAWIPLDTDAEEQTVLTAIKKEDSLQLLTMTSNKDKVSFEKKYVSMDDTRLGYNSANDSVIFSSNEKQEKIPYSVEVPMQVLLFYNDILLDQKRYIQASIKAISTYIKKPIEIRSTDTMKDVEFNIFDAVVWLSYEAVPHTSSKLLIYKPDRLATRIIEKGFDKHTFYLTESLTTQNSIDKNFSEELLAFFDIHQDIKEEISKKDIRSIDIRELNPNVSNIVTGHKTLEHIDISNWLWVLFAMILGIERIIAKRKRQ